jgi:hypothetical protein
MPMESAALNPVLAPIRALARAGASHRALQAFGAAGLDTVADDPAVLTLKGRLLKDSAAGAREARASLLAEAASCYAAAAQRTPATYPLINAATLSFLGGDPARGAALARETLAMLDSGAHEPDTPYWLGATRAEALLLLDREEEARKALRAAVAQAPAALEDRAATLKQFRLILAAQGRPDAWLDAFRPAAMVHFAGPIGIGEADRGLAGSIERAVERLQPASATGALAAGFDIVAAEILRRGGAALHVMLPAPVDAFVAASVRPSGADWEARFEALLAQAASVESLDAPRLSGAAALLAERMALGTVIRDARLCGAEAVMLRMAGAPQDGIAAAPPHARLVAVEGTDGPAVKAAQLAGPDHPVALVGCRLGAADPLERLAGVPVRRLAFGALVEMEDLAAAAKLAAALYDSDPQAQAVLDYGAGIGDGGPDLAGLEALLAIPARPFALATRPAALALEAAETPFRTALAGASETWTGSTDFFSLWAEGEPGSDDQFGQ